VMTRHDRGGQGDDRAFLLQLHNAPALSSGAAFFSRARPGAMTMKSVVSALQG
jgi:hypothetical protein